MKNTVNLISENEWLKPFGSKADVDRYIEECGCDGAEVLRGGDDDTGYFQKDNVIGCHLYFCPDFLDFWRQDTTSLLTHFRDKEEYESYYRATSPYEQMKHYRDDMDYAESLGAEYVVMHVNDVSNEEIFSYKWIHSNEEVIRGMAELTNECLKGRKYHFRLLFENLFTPGMTLLDPKDTELMLDLVNYENKGILLDTGHLMCANENITSEDEGIDFVLETVKRHGELARCIRGMHLHKSVTGNYIQYHKGRNDIVPDDDFYGRFNQAYSIILNIDSHLPFESHRASEIVDLVDPDWICHEVRAQDLEEKRNMVNSQLKMIGI